MYNNEQALFLCNFHAETRLFSVTKLEVLEALCLMRHWCQYGTFFKFCHKHKENHTVRTYLFTLLGQAIARLCCYAIRNV